MILICKIELIILITYNLLSLKEMIKEMYSINGHKLLKSLELIGVNHSLVALKISNMIHKIGTRGRKLIRKRQITSYASLAKLKHMIE